MRAIILKPGTDKKGGDAVMSRLGITKKVDMLLSREENVIYEVQRYVSEHGPLDCILVDEVQFMATEQIDQLFEVAVRMGIPVICYGLRTDFKVNGFEGSARLLLLAHSLEELKTVCRCGKKAVLNGRKINGEFVFEGAQVAIDGVDHVEYESLCAQCYFELKERSLGEEEIYIHWRTGPH
jgi:thymidine kinase